MEEVPRKFELEISDKEIKDICSDLWERYEVISEASRSFLDLADACRVWSLPMPEAPTGVPDDHPVREFHMEPKSSGPEVIDTEVGPWTARE